MLDFLVFCSIITNSAIIAFTGEYALNVVWSARIWIFIIMSSCLVLLKLTIAYIIPDDPREVEIQLERQEFFRSKIQFNKDVCILKYIIIGIYIMYI